jgi:hypothetical protein
VTVHERKLSPAEILQRHHEPTFSTIYLPEPELIFGGQQLAVDPKTGLGVFGPYDLKDPSRRSVIRLGIIGTGPLVHLTQQWIERCQRKVTAARKINKQGSPAFRPMDPIAFSPFPGLREAFSAEFIASPPLIDTITERQLVEIRKIALFEPRVTKLVELLIGRLKVLADKQTPPDVVIIALPTELREICTIPANHARRSKSHRSVAQALRDDLQRDASIGQENLFDVAEVHGIDVHSYGEEEHSVFHHGFKARAMETNIPTQVVWQATLEGTTSVEDDATRAWNFWTGIYYKAGNIPWRATGLVRGTCYVGLSFYRDRRNATLRTCMAQAFSDQGEGIVLRSEPFIWEGSRSAHLPKELASELITRVLQAYEGHLNQRPSRVVVHKWQRYWDDERAGFEEVLQNTVHSSDLVAFSDRKIRFFRTGEEPPLRGTMIALGPKNALLYTRGYVPFLGVYSGMRVPRPVEIVEHFGDASMTQICQEILALTKLDWNSAMFAGKEPITTAFSEDVGHILSELPPNITPKTQYRFYM